MATTIYSENKIVCDAILGYANVFVKPDMKQLTTAIYKYADKENMSLIDVIKKEIAEPAKVENEKVITRFYNCIRDHRRTMKKKSAKTATAKIAYKKNLAAIYRIVTTLPSDKDAYRKAMQTIVDLSIVAIEG